MPTGMVPEEDKKLQVRSLKPGAHPIKKSDGLSTIGLIGYEAQPDLLFIGPQQPITTQRFRTLIIGF